MALSSTQPLALSLAATRAPIPDDDDAHLVTRSQAGDVQAFNLLVERYQREVYGLCFRMLGDADAEDAAQEVFLAAFRAIRRYHGGSFRAWLLRIARNECYDQLRARKRRPHLSLDGDASAEVTPPEVTDPGEAPDERLLRRELAGELQRRLQELPDDQRLIVILSDIQGYSYNEIAAV